MSDILQSIDRFLAKHEMSEWQFGELALKDRHFIRQLRTGRDLRLSTVQRIQDFMDGYAVGGDDAPTEERAA